MALVLKDRVQETTTTSGTGTLTLAGAVSGFDTFSASIGNGNVTYYTIFDNTAYTWEVGIGTVGAGTLARTTVLSNSSGTTSPISLAGNIAFVFCTYPAEKSINYDANDVATIGETLGYSDTGIVGSFASTVAGYNQVIVQNKSTATNASSNLNVSNDAGTAGSNYAELGINSSTFTGTGSFNIAGASYVASASTDLTLGTYGAYNVHFVTNSSTTDAMTIFNDGGISLGGFSNPGIANMAASKFVPGYTSVTSAAGTTILTASSNYYQNLVGTTTQTFRLPDATTLLVGTTFIFDNNSTGTLTVVDNASGTVDTIPSGAAGFVYLVNNSTVAGSWNEHSFLPATYDFNATTANFGNATITNAVWNGTTIASGYGGTGLTTFTAANNALYSTSASNLVAGTLPVAAGGTGASTAFTTGSVVFAGTGGTYSQNNANFFWDDTNNRLGIGTASPTNVLSIYSSTNGNSINTIGDGVGSTISMTRYDSASNGPFLNITKARGSFATPLPVNSFDQAGTINFRVFAGTNTRNVAQILSVMDNYVSDTNVSGYLTFSTNGSSTNVTERMRIDSAGNVGIGTTSPSTYNAKLAVTGNIVQLSNNAYEPQQVIIGASATAGAAPYFIFNRARGTYTAPTVVSAGDSIGTLLFGGYSGASYVNTSFIAAVAEGTINSTTVPTALYFGTGTTFGIERMRIDSSGNVGIGTSSPANTLHVEKSISSNDLVYLNNLGATASDVLRLNTGAVGSGTNILDVQSNSVTRLIVRGDGTVGVNTTSPTSYLSVNVASTNNGINVGDFNSGNGTGAVPAIQTLGSRGDGNQTFQGRFGAAYRRFDGTAITSGTGLGTYAFGGQWGVDTTYQSAKLLYPASITGVAEGSFTSATAMPTAIIFNTGSTGDAIGSVNLPYGTERMRITSAGNVGIGITPSVKLDVYDATSSVLSVDGDSNTSIRSTRYSTDATAPALNFRKARGSKASPATVATSDFTVNLQANAYDGTAFRVTATIASQVETYTTTDNVSGNLTFATRPTGVAAATIERMRIDSSGNVGIGTTTPTVRLDVRSATGVMFNVVESTSGDNRRIRFSNAGTVNTIESTTGVGSTQLAFAVDGSERMRIDSSGNVGIGTTSPADKLQVNGSSNTSSAIRLTNQNTNVGYISNYASFIGSGASNDFTLAAIGALNMVLATNGAERMRIDATGNILVAKASRGTVLTDNDLSFDMNASSNFKCTPTALGTLTFTNITSGQSGFILLVNTGGYAISAAATTEVATGTLTTISTAGTYLLSYFSDGTNVFVTNSGALA